MAQLCADTRRVLDWIYTQSDALTARLIDWANHNSGSYHVLGINQLGDQITSLYGPRLGAAVERRPLPRFTPLGLDGRRTPLSLGDAWLMRKHPDAPVQVLLCGHLDTVYPPDSPFQLVERLDHDTLRGPGVSDMKGGILVLLTALEALERSPLAGKLGWTVLLNPDEEIGSPGSASLLAELARQHDFGLGYEPALPDGGLAGTRKASGNFTWVIHGRSAHAGRNPQEGRNAVLLAAELAQALAALDGQREDLTVNVGYLHGGGAVNQVPDLAALRVNIRCRLDTDSDWCMDQLHALHKAFNSRDGLSAEFEGHFARPAKQLDGPHQQLYRQVQECGQLLGLELPIRPTGGCCDGNNLSAAGLANIDTLGVRGGAIHSPDEFIHLSSLTERSALSALLLLRLARAGLPGEEVTL